MKVQNRPFGCEFEFSDQYDNALPIVKNAIKSVYRKTSCLYAVREYHKSIKNKEWYFKLDSSTGCELATPVSKLSDLSKILKVITNLSNNLKITRSDSLHIHVSVPDIDIQKILVAWIYWEKIILLCFPIYRRNNITYCKKLSTPKKQIAKFFQNSETNAREHHAVFSTYYYAERKTVEFRISENTFSIEHVTSLIKLFLYFVEYCKTINLVEMLLSAPSKETIEELMNEINADEKTSRFFCKRYVRYHSKK